MTDYEVPEFSETEYEEHQEQSSVIDSEQQKINAQQMKKWQKLREPMLEQQFEKDFTEEEQPSPYDNVIKELQEYSNS